MHLAGQLATTSAWMSMPSLAYSVTASLSTWMSSRQVPMMDMSDRAMDATQSFGQPDDLELVLVGEGRPMELVLEVCVKS